MRYVQLKEKLKDFTVFSLAEILKLDPKFNRRRLTEWQKKNYIRKVIKGFYIFSDLALSEPVLFEIANRIYSPSYISFKTALAYYQLIPESVFGITSASTRRTYHFKTPLAEFRYQTLKKNLFFGYVLEAHDKKHFKIACAEKAILDTFYIQPQIRTKKDFASLRINKDLFFEHVSEDKLFSQLEKFSQKKLEIRIRSFWRYMKNA